MNADWNTTMKPNFITELRDLPLREMGQVMAKIDMLVQDPRPDGHVKKQLKHIDPRLHRIRCGDYRIIYTFEYPFISLLALRRRKESTFSEGIGVEFLDGFDPDLPISGNLTTSPLPDVGEEQARAQADPIEQMLPRLITSELLNKLQIPAKYHAVLLTIQSEDELWDCVDVPEHWVTHLLEHLTSPLTHLDDAYSPNVSDPIRQSLPKPITSELLNNLRIPAQYHAVLLTIQSEDELLNCPDIPNQFLAMLIEHQYPLPLQEVMQQADLVPHEIVDPLHSFEQEPTLTYSISVDVNPKEIPIGGEVEVVLSLRPTDNDEAYLLEVPQDEVPGLELNVLLTAPNFHINGENARSLPLDLVTAQDMDVNSIHSQTARFSLTALRSGPAKLQLDLYTGDVFKTSLPYTAQIARIDQIDSFSIHDLTRPRPVRHPDLILQVGNKANADIDNTMSTFFHYHLTSSRTITQIPEQGLEYCSAEFPTGWLERVYTLLQHTLESTAGAQATNRHARLALLGQYLFRSLLPKELQQTLRSLVNIGHTLLILSDQDAVIPWTLLHDGQAFLGEHFRIGRWLRELHNTRYEFPIGVVSIAYYEGTTKPEIWAEALTPPGAPEAIPLFGGLLNVDTTETIRGLHLLRVGKASRATDLCDAPALITRTTGEGSIEQQVQVAKFNLRINHPLVTLSYLHAGIEEITALEQSWSSTFIRAGCSAFIGPLWAVQPSVEATFVSTFYARLWAGDALGEAFKAARELTRTAMPNSIDHLAYVLFGDPMARPYRPVEGDGYATVEPVGREMEDPVLPGTSTRFRVSLRRRPPIWHEGRVIEVAQTLKFEHLKIYVVTFGLQITPVTPIKLMHASTGDYFGWFSLSVPTDIKRTASVVQVHFVDEPDPDEAGDTEFDETEPIHSLRFTLPIAGGDDNGR